MTIHNTLSSTPFSPLANAPATDKPASASSSSTGAAVKSQQSAALAQPAPGTGLVGHLVNTTA
ncbi:hypothetical protein BJG93_14295 [Paraburkholderia sprentiae WSM5005]|uniref:Uncharacterized protein n=1 Tax=Paraburkholderia sprentiae WSM5005 TaxID=754502 RepID=A0A1I9YLB4_9BURK|nr:hypothetical protein [Paraburkholderia sprentiae]APA87097.1 hypothetical protein BJG93_14295 [Paraburkholderia sprentiae WSM5005]